MSVTVLRGTKTKTKKCVKLNGFHIHYCYNGLSEVSYISTFRSNPLFPQSGRLNSFSIHLNKPRHPHDRSAFFRNRGTKYSVRRTTPKDGYYL